MNTAFTKHYELFILDDCAEDREVYKQKLSNISGIDFTVTEAGTFEAAKALTLGRHFDCFVIDYNLPDANGFEFIQYLKEKRKENIHSAALIVVTGQGSEEIASEAFKLGVHEYLTKKSVSDGNFGRPLMNAIERAHLTTQLERFRRELEKSHRDLSEFTHTAAHDLKSPLRRIMSYCEILEEDAIERLTEEEIGILNRMHLNAKRMRELIDSLLTYSLVNTDDEEKRECDLKDMVQEIEAEFAPQLKEVHGEIEVKDLPTISVYPVRMRQLLTNLISNAMKYKSQEPLRIVVDSSFEDDRLIVSIADNGVGIEAEKYEEIFKDFKRLYANDDIEGSGLGLSICKKIAERHGGEIWLESEVGAGSTFFFTIAVDEK